MHMKPRGARAALYRSQWIPRAPDVPHGYSKQHFAGSIRLDAVEIPEALRPYLSAEEADWVDARVCAPARKRAAEAITAAAARERDPNWRLMEAARLIHEGAKRSIERPVASRLADEIRRATAAVMQLGPPSPVPVTQALPGNPVDAVVQAIRAASKLIARPDFPQAPDGGARSSPVYKSWLELTRLIDGAERDSLLRALQAAGYVKKKGGG
jgi:hypothetical protein